MLASKFQRAITYIIDFFIMSTVVTLLSQLIFLILPIDMSMMDFHYEMILKEFDNITNAILDESTYDYGAMLNHFGEYLKYAGISVLVNGLLYLIMVVGYLIILPIFWDKQTIGRLVTKVKVVSVDGNNPSTKQIILRELVGSWLLYLVIGGPLIFISAVIALAKGRSIIDYIAKTNLVSLLEEVKPVESNDNNNDDYVEASFKDVNDNSNDDDYVEAKFVDEDNNDSDDYRII